MSREDQERRRQLFREALPFARAEVEMMRRRGDYLDDPDRWLNAFADAFAADAMMRGCSVELAVARQWRSSTTVKAAA